MSHKKLLRLGASIFSFQGLLLSYPVLAYTASDATQEQLEALDMTSAVTVITGDSDNTATFGGSFPTASTNLIVPEGVTLTIVADDTVTWKRAKVYGRLVVEEGSAGTTTVNYDTTAIMKGGEIYCDASLGGRVDFIVNTSGNMSVSEDPHLVGRGIVSVGKCTILGKPRQFMIPISNDVTAGVTTRLNLTVSPNLGFNGALGDPADPFNYTLLPFDWAAGERGVILSRSLRAPNTPTDPRYAEVVEFASLTKVSNVTNFSLQDTTGSYIDLTAPATKTNIEYYDETARDFSRTNFGPPAGAQTEGSHANWAHRPWLINPNRNVKFKCSDPAAPIHRKGHFQVSSSATNIRWVEFIRCGRTNIFQDTVVEGSAEATPLLNDTNLRHRDVLHVYDAGFCYFDQVKRDGLAVQFIGVSIWDGGYYLGGAQENSAQGAGGYSMGYSQYKAAAYMEACISHNTIGSAFKVYSAQNTYVHRHCLGSEVWGQTPNAGLPFFKDHDDYTRGDMGRDGSVYNYDARTGQNTRCSAHGSHQGLVSLTRSPDEAVYTLESIWMPHGAESVNQRQYANSLLDDVPVIGVEGFVASAMDQYGLIISKNSPEQNNGFRAHIKNCIYDNCRSGGSFYEYTAQYVIEGQVDLGPDTGGAPTGRGFRLGTSLWDFTLINCYIANRDEGVWDARVNAGGDPLPTKNYFVDFKPMRNVTTPWTNINETPGVEILTIGAENYGAPFGATITGEEYFSGGLVRIYGKVRDPITVATGESDYNLLFASFPNESNGIRVDVFSTIGAFSTYGYWQNPGGVSNPPLPFSGVPIRYSKYPITVTNRLAPSQQLQFVQTLAPLMITGDPFGETGSSVWRYPSGKPYAYVDHGTGDWAAALAAANAELNPQGLTFS